MTETIPTAGQQHNGNAAAKTSRGATFSPRVDIFETDNAFLVYADLPGALPYDIDLQFERGELFLRGKVQPRPTGGRVVFNEYDVGDFSRVFEVDDSIDAGKIEADFKNGVLTVRLPKAEAVKPKQVPIKVQA